MEKEMVLVKWTDNNSKRYDGKMNKEYLSNIVKEGDDEVKVGDHVQIKYERNGNLWKAIVVEYPLNNAKKRTKKGLWLSLL